ncbi:MULTISPECIES: hypothetical protein [Paenibacillus]|uniref:Uncharacterized protein n=1 Tax=Paenibacillus glycanilyticus TaxID=126569 RepID=A0ABQ6G5Z0_9BACL|nr:MULTISPECIES: hypothetical protein [Paenibacillus]NIK26601.1 hypothetical protein [Paenibacillus lupini]GLX66391.1 hypothetical protein MU1_07350 [Paenibacillus glycanilyticus]
MRSLLISMLLLVTVILLYTGITGGDDGTKRQVERSGSAIGAYIRQMSP